MARRLELYTVYGIPLTLTRKTNQFHCMLQSDSTNKKTMTTTLTTDHTIGNKLITLN